MGRTVKVAEKERFIYEIKIDSNYKPDEVSAEVKAVGMIYSFYGRLSVASLGIDLFRCSIPSTFYAYGTEDLFYDQMNDSVKAHVLNERSHGFRVGQNDDEWINPFDKWLPNIFKR